MFVRFIFSIVSVLTYRCYLCCTTVLLLYIDWVSELLSSLI